MKLQEIDSYLNSFVNFERQLHCLSGKDFCFERICALLNLLNNPQQNFNCVHVAGSKGKGSTAVFIANILSAAGYKVGLFTSPHLYDYKERIRILDKKRSCPDNNAFCGLIQNKGLLRILNDISPIVDKFIKTKLGQGLTYFEMLTAIAFVYFSKERIDIAVLETGLGGRLDATNVGNSIVCAITPIGLEHTSILGQNISMIAKEKAAIIKSTTKKAVIAPQKKEALRVILNRCKLFKIKPKLVGKNIKTALIKRDLKEQTFSYKNQNTNYSKLVIKLLGPHQISNASVAVGVIDELKSLGYKIREKDIPVGLKQAIWPLRYEIVWGKRMFVLDSAHTTESARSLSETFREILPGKLVTLVFGTSADKDVKGICWNLNNIVKRVIVTKAHHPRALDFSLKELKGYFKEKLILKTDDLSEAIRTALENTPKEDVILITGSIYFAAEARKVLKKTYHV